MFFGVGLFEIGADRVQIRSGLRRSNPRLQMPQREIDPRSSARIQDVPPLHLLYVHHRHIEFRKTEHKSPVEPGRGYTEDGKRMLVELNDAAHNATIILKPGVPTVVAEDDIRSAVRAVFVGAVGEAAEVRLN